VQAILITVGAILLSILLYMVIGPLVFFLTYILPANLILWLFGDRKEQGKRILIVLTVVLVATILVNYCIDRRAAERRATFHEIQREMREHFMSSSRQNS
jgi:hypothetical protein